MKRLESLSPVAHLSGSHLMAGYLRLLGARVGEASHIGSGLMTLPSMLDLGDSVTVGYEVQLRSSEIVNGRLHIGRITMGDQATAGGNTVLVGPCAMGEGSVLRAQSSQLPGSEIPAGEVWSGSPASRSRRRTIRSSTR